MLASCPLVDHLGMARSAVVVDIRLNALLDNQLVADQLASNVNCPTDHHCCYCPAASLVLGVCSVPVPVLALALAPVLVLVLVLELELVPELVLLPVVVDADDVVAVALAGEQLQLVSPPLQQLPLLDRRDVWVAVPVVQDDAHLAPRLDQVVHQGEVVSCRLWGNQVHMVRSHN